MSNEIKEILDYFRRFSTLRDNAMISEIEDYITNLQQELDITNEKWQKDKQFCNCRLEENVELRKENERLKDELEFYKQECDDLEMQIGENNEQI